MKPLPGCELDHPHIDVVILTWNDAVDATRAAASVLASTAVRPHVFVVDNGSDPRFDPPEGVVLLRSGTNLGVAGGRNLGIQAGDSPYVAILDSDACVSPYSFAKLLRPLIDDVAIGLSGPVFTGVSPWETAGRHPTLFRKAARAIGLTRRYRAAPTKRNWWDVDFTIGACQVFRRSLYDAVGGIEAQGLFGPEDVEFCRQVRLAGYRVVQVVDTGVWHEPRRAWRSVLSRRGFHHLVSVCRYYARLSRRSHSTASR